MMTEPSRLTPGLIEELRNTINPATGKTYTQAEIGRMFGVSRQAVSKMKRSHGRFSETPREIVMKAFPWRVPAKLHNAWPNRKLRDHAEYIATGGRGMDPGRLRDLNYFYNKLEKYNVVVEFDPEIPPTDDNSYGGFAYRPRRKTDGDLIIRVNRHTTLTEDGKRIWRMPPRRPPV